MFTVKEEKVFYEERLALPRDLIIKESMLKEIEFDESESYFSKLVLIDGMLVYVLKYKENGCLSNKWHFAFQSLNEGKIPYLYESFNLYLGE